MHQPSHPSTSGYAGDIFIAYQLPVGYSDAQARIFDSPSYSDVFVAYTDDEDCSVRVLENLLKAEGIRPWVGDLEVLLSPVSVATLNQGIRECDALLLLLGAAERVPRELHDELKQALKLNKLILLLARQKCSVAEMAPLGLDRLHWVPIALDDRQPSTTLAKYILDILVYARLQKRTFVWQKNDKNNAWLLSESDLEQTQSRVERIQKHLELGLVLSEQQLELIKCSQYIHGKAPDIFISYSRRDQTFVETLAQDLEEEDFVLWLDWKNIPVAADWREEVKEGIREAHTFIFVISVDSLTSRHCDWELQQARRSGCRIIPIVCRHDYRKEQLSQLSLAELNYASFERLAYAEALAKLVQTIRTDFQDAKEYNKLFSEAYEWDLQKRPKQLLLTRKQHKKIESWLKKRSRKDTMASEVAKRLPLQKLQLDYLNDSKVALQRERQTQFFAVSLGTAAIAFLILALDLAQLSVARALVASLEEKAGLDSLITALRASQKLENRPYSRYLQPGLRLRTTIALHQETMSVRELNRLAGHKRDVFDVEFSPDGDHLVSVGDDKTVRVWNFANSVADPMKRHQDRIVDVAHSPDGSFFVTGSYDGVVNLWSCEARPAEIHSIRKGESHLANSTDLLPTGLEALNYGVTSPGNPMCQWIRALPQAHTDRIVRVRVSPGSQYIASASFDGNVHLWQRGHDYETMARQKDDLVYVLPIRGLSVLPNPRQLFHGQPVFALAFNPRRRHLVSADVTGKVKLWALETGEEISSIDVGNMVVDVQYSHDGKYIAIAGKDGLLKIWDWENDQIAPLPGHVGFTGNVVFHPHDNRLASADTDGNIQLWLPKDLQTALKAKAEGTVPADLMPLTLQGHQEAVLRLQFSPDGDYLASASADDTIRLWLAADGALLDEIEGHQDEVVGLSFSPMLKTDPYSEADVGVTYLASASRDGTVRIWRINNGVRPLPHRERIFDVAFHPNGNVLAAAGRQTISLWRLRDYTRFAYILGDKQGGNIFSVDYAADGKWLVAGASTGMITLWAPDQTTANPIAQWLHEPAEKIAQAPEQQIPPEVLVVRFNLSGNLIASGGDDGYVRFWNRQGELLGEFQIGDIITNIGFSPDGQHVVITSQPNVEQTEEVADGHIAIYRFSNSPEKVALDLVTESALSEDEGRMGGILTVEFNPQKADEFATGDTQGNIRIWLLDGTLQNTLRGHEEAVTRVDYSQDGEMLASSSRDTSVNLWKVRSGDLISSLQGHDRQVTKVVFNPTDSTIMASAGFDDKVLIWQIPERLDVNPLEKLTPIGCQTVKDYLKLEVRNPSQQNIYFAFQSYLVNLPNRFNQWLYRDKNEFALANERLEKNLEEVRKYCLHKAEP